MVKLTLPITIACTYAQIRRGGTVTGHKTSITVNNLLQVPARPTESGSCERAIHGHAVSNPSAEGPVSVQMCRVERGRR